MEYCPLFCEGEELGHGRQENIWKLCQARCSKDDYAVVISNPSREVLMARQGSHELVVWDYHVVLVDARAGIVHDCGSSLGMSVPFAVYFEASFPPTTRDRLFNVVPGAEYIKSFSSDRSHMLDNQGNYISPPPEWEPIWNGEDSLQLLINMHGPYVLTEREFVEFITSRASVAS